MKKTAIVINGAGGVGKDTLCAMAAGKFRVRNVSSIDPVKAVARELGWDGGKTDADRKFLSDLKSLAVAYNDFPTLWAKARYDEFLASDDEILFVHIREGAEIAKFVAATGGAAKTLLIRGGTRVSHNGAFGNASDDGVENYPYDYYFVNDQPLEKTGAAFCAFLSSVLG